MSYVTFEINGNEVKFGEGINASHKTYSENMATIEDEEMDNVALDEIEYGHDFLDLGDDIHV